MGTDWTVWIPIIISTVSIIFSAISTFLAGKQIIISNKQHLFDSRVEVYIIVIRMIQVCREKCSKINYSEEGDPIFAINLDFREMTNNSYLLEIAYTILKPFEKQNQTIFFNKLVDLEILSDKLDFLFSKKISGLLKKFVMCYKELLNSMYQYQRCLEELKDYSYKYKKGLKDAQEYSKEKEKRKELIKNLEDLKQIDLLIEKSDLNRKFKEEIKFQKENFT